MTRSWPWWYVKWLNFGICFFSPNFLPFLSHSVNIFVSRTSLTLKLAHKQLNCNFISVFGRMHCTHKSCINWYTKRRLQILANEKMVRGMIRSVCNTRNYINFLVRSHQGVSKSASQCCFCFALIHSTYLQGLTYKSAVSANASIIKVAIESVGLMCAFTCVYV